jgi:hypothetical protein
VQSRAKTFAPACTSARVKLYSLNDHVLRVSRWDYLFLRDILTSIAVSGSSGSGKTSLLATLERACWSAGHAGLVLCPKPDSGWEAERIASGGVFRADDTIIFNRESGHRWNPLAYALKNAGKDCSVDDALDELWTMVEILDRGEVLKQGDAFFGPAGKQLMRHILTVQIAAYGKVDVFRILTIIDSLPVSFGDLESPHRHQILQDLAVARSQFQPDENVQLDLAESYFTRALVGLSDRTSSSIKITATVKLSALWTPRIYKACFAPGGIEISPDTILQNKKIVILDFPLTDGTDAKAIGVSFKQALQKACLRRAKAHSVNGELPDTFVPVGIWADECQGWLTDFDLEALERGRSSRMYHVYTYQGHSSLEAGYGGDKARALRLYDNLNVKIMCAQSSPETRKMLSETAGNSEVMVLTRGANESNGGNGSSGQSASLTPQVKPVLPEWALLGLKTGQGGIVEVVIWKVGPGWNWNRKRHLKVEFKQGPYVYRLWEAVFEKAPRARPWDGYITVWGVMRSFWQGWDIGIESVKRWAEFWLELEHLNKSNGGGQ